MKSIILKQKIINKPVFLFSKREKILLSKSIVVKFDELLLKKGKKLSNSSKVDLTYEILKLLGYQRIIITKENSENESYL